MTSLTLAKARFAKTGQCDHLEKHDELVRPYGTDVTILQCSVCGKIKNKIYWQT